MKIIILGAGRVGQSVADSLVSERNDITVIDTDPTRLRALQDRLDLRGVISPFYLINGIGAVLTRPGEGLVGFTYRVSGSAANPRVSVNPLSVLAPGFFREMFRRPAARLDVP